MTKPTEAQYLEARLLANQYRSDYPERSGGAVIVFNGQVAGWAKSFLDTVNCWEPNCIAVDEFQTCWLTSEGNSQDGVKIWAPSSYLFFPVVSGVAETRPDLPVLKEPCECPKCKSAHGILNVYAHGLVTVGCPDCWHSDQSLLSVMAESFFSRLSLESAGKAGE